MFPGDWRPLESSLCYVPMQGLLKAIPQFGLGPESKKGCGLGSVNQPDRYHGRLREIEDHFGILISGQVLYGAQYLLDSVGFAEADIDRCVAFDLLYRSKYRIDHVVDVDHIPDIIPRAPNFDWVLPFCYLPNHCCGHV